MNQDQPEYKALEYPEIGQIIWPYSSGKIG